MQIPVRFLDAEGVTWQAVEVATVNSDEAPGALYFFSRSATRRLAAYPADWSRGDWNALNGLRRRADDLSSTCVLAVEVTA